MTIGCSRPDSSRYVAPSAAEYFVPSLTMLPFGEGLVAAEQHEHGPGALPDIEKRLEREARIDRQEPRDLRDRARAWRRHLRTRPGRERRRRRDPAGDLDVRGVPAALTDGDLVLTRRRRRHELVGAEAAHHARVGLYDPVAEPAAVEDLPIGALVGRVRAVERGDVGVEGVGVLHEELARAQHAGPRTRLVALLGLDLVPDLRQVAVGADLARGEPRDDFLVRHPEAQVASVAIPQLEHLRDALPAARLLPDVGRMDHGHRDLLPADRVHLLADDRVDLVEDALPERQVHVDAGGELTHEAG